ncbi:MAG: hypothetical protein OXH16_10610 [Gemmatimonadetes bacterium]|nr:hypothetical protein [Gemmatimonadota bacterium]
MKIFRILTTVIAAPIIIGLSGTGSFSKAEQSPKIELHESQLQIRSMQTRAFDTTDENKTLRAIIATLQDFGFVIKKADEALGTITARRIDKYSLQITVTVRSRGETQVLVRMNAYYGQPVKDPIIYQNFFTSLVKSMFLTAHEVN